LGCRERLAHSGSGGCQPAPGGSLPSVASLLASGYLLHDVEPVVDAVAEGDTPPASRTSQPAHRMTTTALLARAFHRAAARLRSEPSAAKPLLQSGDRPVDTPVDRLARQHGLDVTGLDLDPAMIERARANADRPGNGDPGNGDERRPSFLVGDVASLAFPDRSFDLVVSTLSMHHWADPTAGLAEIGRVLRPGARALIWDFRPGIRPFHAHPHDPVQHTHGTPLRVVTATPWRWPWRFNLTQRIELVRADGAPKHAGT
jgi:SAM-dependent methyltransferase